MMDAVEVAQVAASLLIAALGAFLGFFFVSRCYRG